MQSSLCGHPKFDQLLATHRSNSFGPDNGLSGGLSVQPSPPSNHSTTNNTSTTTTTKTVHWKLDNSGHEEALAQCGRLLDDELAAVTAIGRVEWALVVDDETMRLVRDHYLDQVELNASQQQQNQWPLDRSLNTGDEDQEQQQKQQQQLYQLYSGPVLSEIDRLRAVFGSTVTTSDSVIAEHGSGGDEYPHQIRKPMRKPPNLFGDLFAGSMVSIGMAPSCTTMFGDRKQCRKFGGGGGGGVPVIQSPLYSGWQLWFWRSDQRFTKWEYGLQKLGKPLHSVEKMRSLVAQLIPLDDVAIPSDYLLFRRSIKPKWEDVANVDGGSWCVEFHRSTTDVSVVSAVWTRLLELPFQCCNVGDTDHTIRSQQQHKQQQQQPRPQPQLRPNIDGDDGVMIDAVDAVSATAIGTHISGLKISLRYKSYQIAVWTDNFLNLESVFQVGVFLRRMLDRLVADGTLTASTTPALLYQAHKVAQNKALFKERTKLGFDHNAFLRL